MAWTEIIVAVLALIGTLAGTIVGNRSTANLVSYRISELEKKVEKHNNVVERTYALEKDVATIRQDITAIKEKLHDD